jgi:hypothetical protein
MVQVINWGLRFVLELCLLAALGYWGFQLEQSWLVRIMVGIGAPLLAAVIWGLFVAPKATRLLADPWRFGLEILLFAWGSGALWLAERPSLAAALFFIFLMNRVLLMAWSEI